MVSDVLFFMMLHTIVPYQVICVEHGDTFLILKADSVLFISSLNRHRHAQAQAFVPKTYFRDMLCYHLFFASGKLLAKNLMMALNCKAA